MSLIHLFVFIGIALFISIIGSQRWRGYLLLVGSIVAIYWLQPPTPIRQLDFWLPTLTVAITGIVYFSTRPTSDQENRKLDRVTGFIILVLFIFIAALRYFDPLCCITPTTPPPIGNVFIGIVICLFLWGLGHGVLAKNLQWVNLLIVFLLGLFLIQKNGAIATFTSAWLRSITGQSVELAGASDLPWIGYSYIAFRLIHVLRDRITGRLPEINLQEMMTYIVFFPTFTAGPIDRIQRFVDDLRTDFSLRAPNLLLGGKRISIGMFKKFAIADSLALIALNAENASEVADPLWIWIMLYAYSFRIYFDFSGYTDIAIGIAQLLGFTLPENFNRSYLHANLTTFWNNWHMTLTQWFRAYFFNPITRTMRSSKWKLPMWLIILFGQLSTMILIGLWHGITWNFIIWGVWHGIGLFVHNRWAIFAKSNSKIEEKSLGLQKILSGVNVLITFNFVSLGWLWFVLPNRDLSIQVFRRLFGM